MNEQHTALSKLAEQIRFSAAQYTSHGLDVKNYSSVVIAGLGGSGIGGRLAKALFAGTFPVPIECVSDYTLPGYVNEKTLAILCSYSGNTEETLSVFEDAKQRGCTMIAVTSGGRLKELATEHKLPLYLMQDGFQPRMALGFSLTYLLLVLGEISGKDVKPELMSLAEAVADYKVYMDEATEIFERIKTRTKSKFVVLADGPMEPVGIRFSQQINENAKHECFCHVVPEMNHNVIESYYGKLDTLYFFIDSHSSERVSARFEFLNNLLEVEYNKVVTVPMEEFSIKSVVEVIYVLDWLSLFVADQRSVDSLNVPNIKSLKEFLEQIG